MKNLIKALVMVIAISTLTSQAHAALTRCTLNFNAKNLSLGPITATEGTGQMTCIDAYGNKKSDKVGIMSAGPSVGIGFCKVSGKMEFAGAGITWNNALNIFATAEIGPVFGRHSYGVGVAASPTNPNVQVNISKVKHSVGCIKLLSVQLGGLMDYDLYQQKIDEREQRRKEREEELELYGR